MDQTASEERNNLLYEIENAKEKVKKAKSNLAYYKKNLSILEREFKKKYGSANPK